MRTRRALGCVAIVTMALGLAVDIPVAGATSSTPTVTATIVPVPSGYSNSSAPHVDAISCGAPGSCTSVGTYLDSSSHWQGLIETWSGGVWTAQKAPVPDVTVTSEQLSAVDCSSASTCVASGSDSQGPVLLILAGGAWTATDATNPSGYTTITGVGCVSSGACAAVGNVQSHGFVDFFHNGAWSVITAPEPHDAGTPSTLSALSCSDTQCIGVGSYSGPSEPEPLAVAIDPTGATANANAIPMPTDSTTTDVPGSWFANIGCSAAGPCVAYGQYTATTGSHEFLEPLGGAGFQPLVAPTLNNSGPMLWAVACGSGSSCVVAGSYSDVSGHTQGLLDVLSGSSWTPLQAPMLSDASSNPQVAMKSAGCGSASFCVTAASYSGSSQAGSSYVLDVLTGSTWTALRPSYPNSGGASSPVTAISCDAPDSCLGVGGTLVVERIQPAAPDTVAPTVSLTAPVAAFTLATSAAVSWHGADNAGGSGIAYYQVRLRRAAYNAGFPATWTLSSHLSAATTSIHASLAVGYDYCFAVRAVDNAGNSSAWSGQRCTAMPLDDRSLTASSGWTRPTSSLYYRGTYSATTKYHATLTRTGAQFQRVALVATRCPSCGKVGVYSGTTLLGTVNLYAASTIRKAILTLPTVSLRTATLTIKVLTSAKTIQIDGLGISRT